MYRILLTGQRSFIFKAEDVIEGGFKMTKGPGKNSPQEIRLDPDKKKVYKISDDRGKWFEQYYPNDIIIVEKVKEVKPKDK